MVELRKYRLESKVKKDKKKKRKKRSKPHKKTPMKSKKKKGGKRKRRKLRGGVKVFDDPAMGGIPDLEKTIMNGTGAEVHNILKQVRARIHEVDIPDIDHLSSIFQSRLTQDEGLEVTDENMKDLLFRTDAVGASNRDIALDIQSILSSARGKWHRDAVTSKNLENMGFSVKPVANIWGDESIFGVLDPLGGFSPFALDGGLDWGEDIEEGLGVEDEDDNTGLEDFNSVALNDRATDLFNMKTDKLEQILRDRVLGLRRLPPARRERYLDIMPSSVVPTFTGLADASIPVIDSAIDDLGRSDIIRLIIADELSSGEAVARKIIGVGDVAALSGPGGDSSGTSALLSHLSAQAIGQRDAAQQQLRSAEQRIFQHGILADIKQQHKEEVEKLSQPKTILDQFKNINITLPAQPAMHGMAYQHPAGKQILLPEEVDRMLALVEKVFKKMSPAQILRFVLALTPRQVIVFREAAKQLLQSGDLDKNYDVKVHGDTKKKVKGGSFHMGPLRDLTRLRHPEHLPRALLEEFKEHNHMEPMPPPYENFRSMPEGEKFHGGTFVSGDSSSSMPLTETIRLLMGNQAKSAREDPLRFMANAMEFTNNAAKIGNFIKNGLFSSYRGVRNWFNPEKEDVDEQGEGGNVKTVRRHTRGKWHRNLKRKRSGGSMVSVYDLATRPRLGLAIHNHLGGGSLEGELVRGALKEFTALHENPYVRLIGRHIFDHIPHQLLDEIGTRFDQGVGLVRQGLSKAKKKVRGGGFGDFLRLGVPGAKGNLLGGHFGSPPFYSGDHFPPVIGDLRGFKGSQFRLPAGLHPFLSSPAMGIATRLVNRDDKRGITAHKVLGGGSFWDAINPVSTIVGGLTGGLPGALVGSAMGQLHGGNFFSDMGEGMHAVWGKMRTVPIPIAQQAFAGLDEFVAKPIMNSDKRGGGLAPARHGGSFWSDFGDGLHMVWKPASSIPVIGTPIGILDKQVAGRLRKGGGFFDDAVGAFGKAIDKVGTNIQKVGPTLEKIAPIAKALGPAASVLAKAQG